MRRYADAAAQFAAPAALLVVVGVVGSHTSFSVQTDFETALVRAAIVIAIYVFVGNSGVISFGHISFVALGDVLAANHRVYIDSYVFLLVILVLLLRPAGLFAPLRATPVERV